MKRNGQSAGKNEREKFEFVMTFEYEDTGRKPDKKTGRRRLRRINIPVGGKDYVTCRECKRKFTWLEWHLLKKHHMTKQEYHKKHGPQWKTICDTSRDALKAMEEQFKQKHLSLSLETIR